MAELDAAINDWIKGIKGGKERAMKILGHEEKTVIETEMKVGTGKAIVGMRKIYEGAQNIENQVKRIQKTDVRSLSSLKGKLRQFDLAVRHQVQKIVD